MKKFWCVKYYKAQPYNMEHTLCVCVWYDCCYVSCSNEKKIYEISVERINESFMEGIKESTEIKMGVAHVACNGVCVCVCTKH